MLSGCIFLSTEGLNPAGLWLQLPGSKSVTGYQRVVAMQNYGLFTSY
jgi:hypothetical protein